METIERTPRPEKVAVVQDVETRLNEANATILTEYRGISVKDLERLRRTLKANGGEYKVYKNTLVRRAAKAAGVEVIEPLLIGPTGMTFVSGDVSAVAKVLRDFSRENANLVVKGGLIGRDLIDARGTAALAELPSREVLLAQIAGMLAAPMQHFASLLNAVPQKLAYALSALIEARGGEAPASTDESADEAPVVDAASPESSSSEPEATTATDEPTAEEPTAEEPTAEEPTAEEPTAEEPTADDPAAGTSVEQDAKGQDQAVEEQPAPEASVETTEPTAAPEEPAGE